MMRSGEISGEISVNIEFLGFLWCGERAWEERTLGTVLMTQIT